ncbi:MAG: pyridoxamine 5'-phosphate oxidase family protein [Promethearchaeota archaeon]
MSYTQPPHLNDDEIEEFINSAKIARICSHNKDDTIHAVPVWYYYENGVLNIGAPKNSRRVRNISRNSNVTVLIDEFGPPTRGVIIYGKASIDEEILEETAISIFKRYMPQEKAKGYYKGLSEIGKWVKITVKPFHIASFDYGKDTTYLEATSKYTS